MLNECCNEPFTAECADILSFKILWPSLSYPYKELNNLGRRNLIAIPNPCVQGYGQCIHLVFVLKLYRMDLYQDSVLEVIIHDWDKYKCPFNILLDKLHVPFKTKSTCTWSLWRLHGHGSESPPLYYILPVSWSNPLILTRANVVIEFRFYVGV